MSFTCLLAQCRNRAKCSAETRCTRAHCQREERLCYPAGVRISVVGAGYVGLVTGVHLAADGHTVRFVETAEGRLRDLAAGRVPIEEPGLAEAFAESASRINVSGDVGDLSDQDLVLIAVGTPIGEAGDPDLSQLRSALDALRDWPELDVSVRSTLPPGTSLRLPALLGRTGGEHISTNPEFRRQGSAMSDHRRPTRIVIGTFPETGHAHRAKVEALFAGIEAPRLFVDVTAAELIKNVANGFLALKLSFVNEVAALSEEYGVEVQSVLDGIALDPRIGSTYMRPGLGFGGSCLPKELQVLAAAGRRQGLPMHLARAVSQVNLEQQDRFVRRIQAELPREDARIALLGLSFKADTDDLRGSPALHVARRLLDAGVQVVAHDPAVHADRAEAAAPGIIVVQDPLAAVDDADAIVIGTEWPVYAAIDWTAARRRVRFPVIFDGRNLVDPEVAASAGFLYRGIGRLAAEPAPVEAVRS
jgi:UDPglucose 6-dehydrogenase